MNRLFGLAERMKEQKINLILIQIDEAHSDAWPMAIDILLNVPLAKSHKTFQDRIDRAKYFKETYNPPFDLYIDGWNNEFAESFRAWPDKYYCINKDKKVIAKSEYNKHGSKEATVIVDVTIFIEELIDSL